MSRTSVGIDLGTTHSALAFARDTGEVRVLSVPQLVGATVHEAQSLLPSVLHAPPGGEALGDPLPEPPFVVGRYAAERAAELPSRTVSSAKSWLSNARISRNEPILPWGSDDAEAPRLSPVDASARILRHLARAWQQSQGSALGEHDITLTVPASFDDTARLLTVQAAEAAGLQVRLLEEPVAAFHDWLEHADMPARAQLASRERILVVDVGGGTCDFSLLTRQTEHFERTHVGRHLLLGGDNVDLALAHRLEERSGQELSALRFAELAAACRVAKETLLGQGAPEHVVVTLAGRGARLVGSTLRAELGRDEVVQLVHALFLPEVDLHDALVQKSALRAFGLPYERDVAITRHLAGFLREAGEMPDALLLNGGFFQAPRLAERVRAQVEAWSGAPPLLLHAAAPELAVARGAASHGRSLQHGPSKVRTRTTKSYWLALPEQRALCLLPRGAEEGQPLAGTRSFEVLQGTPVRFLVQARDQAGEAFAEADWDTSQPSLPLVASLPGRGSQRVTLETERNALGLLELRLREHDGRTHRLSFDLRKPARHASQQPPPASAGDAAVLAAFARDADPKLVKDLSRELERRLGERASWTGDVLRPLADALIGVRGARRKSADHERVLWNLLGYALRPGRGAPGDAERMREVEKLVEQRLSFPDKTQNWQAFFIALRRVASGLSSHAQVALTEELAPSVVPGRKPKKKGRIVEVAHEELRELLSSLEYAPKRVREDLGHDLVERAYVKLTPRTFTDLSRLGARVPAYAGTEAALDPKVVEGWLEALLRQPWQATPVFVEAALAMARLTGDRARDLSQSSRQAVDRKLAALDVEAERRRALHEVQDVHEAATLAFYGDALPLGLRLGGA